MPLTYMGISTWIENNRGEELPQYAVKPCGRRSMQCVSRCWIPVSERSQFKIMWKVLNAPGTDLDLLVFPFFDGIPLCACSWTKDQVDAREVGELGHHPTGRSSIRQYEFGHREVTDTEDFQTGRPRAVITELNTIKIRFAWGYQKNVDCAGLFSNPTEVAPIHETEIKAMRGLSGSACLSQDEINTRYKYSSCEFLPEAGVKSTTFIFRYAPLGKLIILRSGTHPTMGLI
ncbi:hypothetical protein AG1IA_02656 [Rhizoctonia solani AG-1 IA]|uniref:Uncharacterized protein n=1 Tax=Thanatephorus cucumeris (strain AG1-IA) TaxID=983506 RepID=L8X3U6_THACA|nr:hypothetical protein AG1IA_02656 [Rhizoctonia solani AG-1 IA]